MKTEKELKELVEKTAHKIIGVEVTLPATNAPSGEEPSITLKDLDDAVNQIQLPPRFCEIADCIAEVLEPGERFFKTVNPKNGQVTLFMPKTELDKLRDEALKRGVQLNIISDNLPNKWPFVLENTEPEWPLEVNPDWRIESDKKDPQK